MSGAVTLRESRHDDLKSGVRKMLQFALAELPRYKGYDITGQYWINAGFVLIKGERAGLDLQSAEAVKP